MVLNNFSPEHVKELKDELADLSNKHVDALQSAIYVGMDDKEAYEYDQSRVRISELYALLRMAAEDARTSSIDLIHLRGVAC